MKIIFKLLILFTLLPHLSFAQSDRGGSGGDIVIGTEFYMIAGRLANQPELAEYDLTSLLNAPVHIHPSTRFLYVYAADGTKTKVDALSEQIAGTYTTKVHLESWNLTSCAGKYRLALHELFVLKKIEPSLSYPVSDPIMEKLTARGLDCSGTGIELERIRLDNIRTILEKAYQDYTVGEYVPGEDANVFFGGYFVASGMENLFWKEAKKTSEYSSYLACAFSFGSTPQQAYTREVLVGRFAMPGATAFSIAEMATRIYNHCYREGGINVQRLNQVQIEKILTSTLEKYAQHRKDSIAKPPFFRARPGKMKRFFDQFSSALYQDLAQEVKTVTEGFCAPTASQLLDQSNKDRWMKLRYYEVAASISKLCTK